MFKKFINWFDDLYCELFNLDDDVIFSNKSNSFDISQRSAVDVLFDPPKFPSELDKYKQVPGGRCQPIVESSGEFGKKLEERLMNPFTENQLETMWNQQDDFMRLLQTHRGFPLYPVELTSKDGQRHIKNVGHDAMHELFEALHLLKNSKNHRKTEIKEFDRAEFVEEIVDAQKFILEMLILAGVSREEFYEKFQEKTHINNERILGNY